MCPVLAAVTLLRVFSMKSIMYSVLPGNNLTDGKSMANPCMKGQKEFWRENQHHAAQEVWEWAGRNQASKQVSFLLTKLWISKLWKISKQWNSWFGIIKLFMCLEMWFFCRNEWEATLADLVAYWKVFNCLCEICVLRVVFTNMFCTSDSLYALCYCRCLIEQEEGQGGWKGLLGCYVP